MERFGLKHNNNNAKAKRSTPYQASSVPGHLSYANARQREDTRTRRALPDGTGQGPPRSLFRPRVRGWATHPTGIARQRGSERTGWVDVVHVDHAVLRCAAARSHTQWAPVRTDRIRSELGGHDGGASFLCLPTCRLGCSSTSSVNGRAPMPSATTLRSWCRCDGTQNDRKFE